MSFFGFGSGGLKVDILLDGPDDTNKDMIVPMHHAPSWKLRKNPFWRIGVSPPQVSPAPTATSSAINPLGAGGGMTITMKGLSLHDETLYAYEASQDVKGKVILSLPPGKKADHLGIKIQFIGRIETGHGVHDGRPNYDFISLSKELAPPGAIYQSTTEFTFTFCPSKLEGSTLKHESYTGRNVNVRYFIKVQIERKFLPPITKERNVWLQRLEEAPPTANEPIQMEVGIEDCLHIEFEYEKRAYHMQDVIEGKIHFLLVRIKIKYMELAVIRRETSGDGVVTALSNTGGDAAAAAAAVAQVQNQNIFTETQTLVKYEIMDGCPFAKDMIPVRLSLEGIPADLTPTYQADATNRFSVRYYLNLVLVDEEDRRYFKQQEIVLWRRKLG